MASTMSYVTISLGREGPLAHLELRRPEEGNALTQGVLEELRDACRAIAEDDGIRAVILSGGDGPSFCRGWDPSLLEGEGLAALRWACQTAASFSFLADLPQPTICAINGDAISAGLEMALACDIRLACPEARFALPEVSLGLIPLAGGTQRLARIVGRAYALALVLSARPIDAQEAWRIGLVNQVVPRGQLLATARELALTIAERGPIAVRFAKEAVRRGLDLPLPEALRLETDLAVILQTTADRAEGVRAFLEKRPPNFRGR